MHARKVYLPFHFLILKCLYPIIVAWFWKFGMVFDVDVVTSDVLIVWNFNPVLVEQWVILE